MELFVIPIEDKFIIYRPLRRLAFVGNQAMAQVAREVAAGESSSAGDLPPSALSYLEKIGFLEPDPPPPPPRETEYRPTCAVLLCTSRCNLRCVYCYANAGQGAIQDMPIELARTAIDHAHHNARELGRSKFDLVLHGGGEPTLIWKTLQEAVAYARAKDLPCHISLVSNGIWTQQQREWLLHSLDQLTISFDGSEETQDGQRPFASGKGTFAAAMETIGELDRVGMDYGVRMTALGPWQGRLVKDVEFICQGTGCRRIQVEPALDAARGEYRPPTLDESTDFVAGFMEAYAVTDRLGRRLVYSGARPWLLTHSFCSAPHGGLVVTAAGDLVTCYEVTSPQHPLAEMCTIGRIEDGQVFVDLDKRRSVLSSLAARREACRDCFCYWHCAGDCHVKTFYPGAEAGPQASTRCHTNRSITAQILLWQIAASDDGVWRDERRLAHDPDLPGKEDGA